MVAAQKDMDGMELTAQLRREEERRLEAGTLMERLPGVLRLADTQEADWRVRWTRATRGAPIGYDEAIEAAAAFLNPVLQRAVEGKRWVAARQHWGTP
jgi:hypothetical protein